MGKPTSILIVEDERIVAFDIRNTLQNVGYNVLGMAVSGAEAVELAEKTRPDLTLMDIVLQGDMDGIQAAEQIRTRFGIPIIYLTANSDGPIIERARATEPIGYVLKPFDERELLTTIEISLHQFVTARDRANEELRASEERFRHAFEYAPIGMAMVALDGRWMDVNKSLCDMLGYSRDELLDTSFVELTHPDDLGKDEAAGFRLLSKEADFLQIEKRFLHKSGETVWINLSSSLVLDSDGTPSYVISQIENITQRKLAEDALLASEERYRSLVTALTEGIVLHDSSGAILTCNTSAERILGLTIDQMTGRTSLDPRWRAVHEDGSPFPGETHPAMVTLQTGEPCNNIIMGVYKPDDTLTWISINSQPIKKPGEIKPYAIVASFADITERRQAEEKQREAELRYRALFNQSHDAIFIVSVEGAHLDINQRAADMLGYAIEELRGLSVKDISAEGQESLHVLQRLLRGEHIPIYERLFQKKNGEALPVEINAELVRDSHGKPLHIQSIVRDITERKQAQEALHASEERFRALIEEASDGIVLLGEDMSFQYVSPAGTRVFGYEPGDLKQYHPDLLTHPEDMPIIVNVVSDILENPSHVRQCQYRFKHRDGNWLWVESTFSNLLSNPAVKAIAINFRDITERKQAEALYNSKQRLDLAIEASGGAYYEHTPRYDDGFLNPRWAEMFGYRLSELPPMAEIAAWWRERLHPEDQARALEMYEQFLAGQASYDLEYRFQHRSGEWRWYRAVRAVVDLDAENRPARIAGLTFDITERKLAEEKLQQSETKYRRLHESMMDAFVLTKMDGQILESNVAYQNMVGYTDEELYHLTYNDLTPENWHALEAQIVADQILPTGSSGVYEKEYRRKDGTIFPVELNTYLIRDTEGQPQQMWAIVRDITERKRAEQQIQSHVRELAELNEDLTRFNRAAVEREQRMIELKKEINALHTAAGLPPRYPLEFENETPRKGNL